MSTSSTDISSFYKLVSLYIFAKEAEISLFIRDVLYQKFPITRQLEESKTFFTNFVLLIVLAESEEFIEKLLTNHHLITHKHRGKVEQYSTILVMVI